MDRPARRRAARALPGDGLGYPSYHGISGNMPVITQRFHVPPSDGAAASDSTAATTAYAWWTGNQPVLSRDLLGGTVGDDDLMPGWVQLRDSILQRQFWWNSFYRSRRESRPTPRDDGRIGAGLGEAEGKLLDATFVRRTSGWRASSTPGQQAVTDDALARLVRSLQLSSATGAAGGIDEDDTVVWPSYRGYLKKEGGGESWFGRKSWKERYFVVAAGTLSYFPDVAAFEHGSDPLKSLNLPLRYYVIDPMPAEPLRFRLVAVAAAATSEAPPAATQPPGEVGSAPAASAGAGGGGGGGASGGGDAQRPPAATIPASGAAAGASPTSPGAATVERIGRRAFYLEAASAQGKVKWLRVLRGRRLDGRRREDSDVVDCLEAAAQR